MARASRDPASPLRTRLFIPAADASTIQWIESQENVSVSLRTVIHEVIERCGYGDVFNRQVEQQPRRGRPPGDASESSRPAGDANDQSRPAQSQPLLVEDAADLSERVASVAAPERTQVSEPIEPQVASEPVPVRAPIAPPVFTDKPAAPASPTRPAPAPSDADARVNDAIMDLLA